MRNIKQKYFLLLSFFIFLFAFPLKAQILKPVKWSYSYKLNSEKEAQIIFTAIIESKWHLYSQFVPPDGPVPTKFTFDKSKDYQLKGKVIETKPITEFDKNFDMTVKYFTKKAVFIQNITLSGSNNFVFKGKLEFMCCDD